MPPLLSLTDISLSLGGNPLLDGAGFAVGAGERLCLVGRNGSGKSTLLRIAAGLAAADGGTRFLQPGATLRYLPQEPDLSGFATTLDYVAAGLGPDEAHRAAALLDRIGLTGRENPATISGGEARRCAIARVLAAAPDLLLLDEPTNHLDLPGIEWLEAELGGTAAGIVLVSHDRRLLQTLSRRTVWLDGGVTRELDRGFAAFEPWRDSVLEEAARDRHKLGRQIAREEDWLRYGVTARRKRNVRRVAELAALRAQRAAQRGGTGGLRLAAATAAESGTLVMVAEGATLAVGGREVVRGLDLRVLRGDRLGIVGPNGAGKTSLLRLLMGEAPPSAGSVRAGTRLAPAVLDQLRAGLDPRTTLAETLTGGAGDQVRVGGEARHVIGYMKDFLFRPEQARTPVGTLSGGERGRLALAVALARPSNLLVLDEPTNDLDLETLDLLQEMLGDYAGTVLLVSHDRDFLDRVATSILAAEGDGRWVEYAGGYTDMLAQRGETPAATQGRPRRAPGPPPRPAPASASASASASAGPSRKLGFKDQRALDTLPAEMDRLRAEAARAQAALADADLYRRDPARFAALGEALAAAESGLLAAEERWLELELRREALLD